MAMTVVGRVVPAVASSAPRNTLWKKAPVTTVRMSIVSSSVVGRGPTNGSDSPVHRVVTNLGVFDFNGPDHQMRAVSLHPGVSPDDVREATSFEVHGLDEADKTRLATSDELKLIREVIDPKSLRDKEVRV